MATGSARPPASPPAPSTGRSTVPTVGIVDEDVARVRAATDFVAVASEHVALKRVGRQWVGLCPFHDEKSPSFSVNAEQGIFHCFGCQAGGDVITFVRELEHLDFAETVERLASRAGIQLRYDDVREGRDRQRRDRLAEAVGRAVEWYHGRLLTGADAAAARGYLRSRGYDGELVRRFRLGWAPDEWDALARHLHLPDDELTDSGLGFVNRRGRQQDDFRGRVLFPIFDPSGRAVAFGGRALPGADGPKYKNSRDGALYAKSRILYALNWAKADVAKADEVIVCEGYTDVIGFFRSGLPRAVATCGTALADDHFRLLKNFAHRIVLAYDADAAGQAAAERFYEWERHYELDVVVADLPAGADPGQLAERDPEALRRAVAEARPFLAFRLERVLGGADLRTAEARARAAEAALAVVAQHPNALVRDQYLMEVADRCRLDVGRLRQMAADPRRRTGGLSAPVRTARRRERDGPELEALRLAIQRPEEMAERLEEVLFADEVHLAAFRALAGSATLHDAIAGAPEEAAVLLRRLAVEEATSAAADVLGRVVREATVRAVASLERDVRAEPGRLAEHAPTIDWLRKEMARLPDLDALDRLVPWLVRWGRESA